LVSVLISVSAYRVGERALRVGQRAYVDVENTNVEVGSIARVTGVMDLRTITFTATLNNAGNMVAARLTQEAANASETEPQRLKRYQEYRATHAVVDAALQPRPQIYADFALTYEDVFGGRETLAWRSSEELGGNSGARLLTGGARQ